MRSNQAEHDVGEPGVVDDCHRKRCMSESEETPGGEGGERRTRKRTRKASGMWAEPRDAAVTKTSAAEHVHGGTGWGDVKVETRL